MMIWEATPGGTDSSWDNMGFGDFQCVSVSGGGGGGKKLLGSWATTGGLFISGDVNLPQISITNKIYLQANRFWTIAKGHTYWNSPYYEDWRKGERSKQIDDMQSMFDAVGTIDPTGIVDGLNGLGYLARGQRANAGIAAIGIIPFGDIAKGSKLFKGTYSVYHGLDGTGAIKYVGITSRNPLVRFAEHLSSLGSGKELLRYDVISSGLSKEQARVLEQTIINFNGLEKNGGALLNKINSIAEKNWARFGITK